MSKPWTEKDERFLIDNYHYMSNEEISKILNRTCDSLRHKAKIMGLKKSQEYLDSYKKSPIKKYNYNHFTYDDLKNIAIKYKTKSEFFQSNRTAYYKAKKIGIFSDICSHMIDQSFSAPQLSMKCILDKLLNENGDYNSRKIIPPYEIDLYYKDFKLAFEYDGNFWHNGNKNDDIKNSICKSRGITLIRILEIDKYKYIDDI